VEIKLLTKDMSLLGTKISIKSNNIPNQFSLKTNSFPTSLLGAALVKEADDNSAARTTQTMVPERKERLKSAFFFSH
jgi:hypothetical protein